MQHSDSSQPETWMRQALTLARRGLGATSPNPMVGAILLKHGAVIGRGWHRRAGLPHAEIEAFQDARRRGNRVAGATLYVTLEPCSTTGRTPPCTEAIIREGIRRVVIGATDPNPAHAGRAVAILGKAGITVKTGILENACRELNESFNQWIVHHTPLVTVKAAMTLDGKIATATGQSKWITSEASRAWAMKLRKVHDAILVGVNTILADNPSLTVRGLSKARGLRRIILDSAARTPLSSTVVAGNADGLTTIVVRRGAPRRRIDTLSRKVHVIEAPGNRQGIDLGWLLAELGRGQVTSLLVEGGGEVNASFLLGGLAHRIAFFFAPKILGGSNSRPGVAGNGVSVVDDALRLEQLRWRRLGPDFLLTARLLPLKA